jgi:hypothetical protein
MWHRKDDCSIRKGYAAVGKRYHPAYPFGDTELAMRRGQKISFSIRISNQCVFYRLYNAFRIRRSC